MTLSKSAEMIQKSLLQKGLEFEVIELAASTGTANDAASQLQMVTGGKIVSIKQQT